MLPLRLRSTPLLAACAALAFSLPARAADPVAVVEEGAPTQVVIGIQVIAASHEPGGIDPKLRKLSRRLQDFAFTSYRVLDEQRVTLGPRGEKSVPLPGGRQLVVAPRRYEASGKVRLRLTILSPKRSKLVDADYSIEPGGDLIIGGMRLDDDALLVALHHGT